MASKGPPPGPGGDLIVESSVAAVGGGWRGWRGQRRRNNPRTQAPPGAPRGRAFQKSLAEKADDACASSVRDALLRRAPDQTEAARFNYTNNVPSRPLTEAIYKPQLRFRDNLQPRDPE